MWLLPGMGSNVPSLVFETVKSLITHGTFVRTRKFRPLVLYRILWWHERRKDRRKPTMVQLVASFVIVERHRSM